jgi:hypothetical protein
LHLIESGELLFQKVPNQDRNLVSIQGCKAIITILRKEDDSIGIAIETASIARILWLGFVPSGWTELLLDVFRTTVCVEWSIAGAIAC